MKSNVGIGVAQPQSALDVAGDINTSGTVYANNLYAQNSIAIGTLKISNGAPGSGKDSIASPYKLALVSAGREISLISDTVKIGDYASTVRFDVNGSVRVRDMLWVEDGIIVGKKFEGGAGKIDTMSSKRTLSKYVEAASMKADTITTAISKTDTAITQRLIVAGDAKIVGNTTISGNLKVSGSLTGITGFDSLHVFNKIKIGHSILIEGYDPLGGPDNKIYTDDYNVNGNNDLLIQCNQLYTSGSHNTIINANNLSKVGIGTDAPQSKLHLHSDEMTDPGDPAYATLPQIPDVDDEGNDIIPSQTISGNNTIPFPPPPIGFTTFQITNTTTGATSNDGFKIMETGTTSYLNAASGNMVLSTPYASSFAISSGGINLSAYSANIFMQANRYNFRVNNFGIAMTITQSGKVGISTSIIPDDYLLAVNGKIISTEVTVLLKADWPDFVFDKNYSLMSYSELEKNINQNKKLPGVPSATYIKENGVQLGEMNKVLLQKVEELTLYIIELNKRIEVLEANQKK